MVLLGGLEEINKAYQHSSYWDLYSTQVVLVGLITSLLIFICVYFWLGKHSQEVRDNWATMRCKPWILPFAGWIYPEQTNTSENFQFCIQNILLNMMGYVLAPFNYLIAGATASLDEIGQGIAQARNMTSQVRTSVSNITEETLGKIVNFLIPIQNMSIAFVDTMQKIQGILVSGLYTTLGTYYALQSVLGAVLDFIIKILLALVLVIVGLWLTPVTWGVAATMTGIFTAIAVPMAVISVFMTQVMHIPVDGIPKLRCFAPNTLLKLQTGHLIHIQDCKLGQILSDGGKITAILKLDANNLNMYNLHGVTVSGCHYVYWQKQGIWIPVNQHPDAIPIQHNLDYVYCLNTTQKQIPIGTGIYADWDELYDPDVLSFVLNYDKQIGNGFHQKPKKDTIYREFNTCMDKNTPIWLYNYKTLPISNIHIGQRLINNTVVYGIVKSLGKHDDVKYHLLSNGGRLLAKHNKEEILDYNGDLDIILASRSTKRSDGRPLRAGPA